MADTQTEVFREAVAALDAGDTERLERMLRNHDWLAGYVCRDGALYEQGYFAGAKLLWHVAGNPDRGPLPPNIVDLTRMLVGYGASAEDVERTVGLVLTSRRASEAGVAMDLIDALIEDGSFDVTRPGLLDEPLLNEAPATALALVGRGALVELRHASALGRLAAMTRLMDGSPAQGTLDEALAFACVRGQRDSASLLVRRGGRGDGLVAPGGRSPRTALHEAANRGHEEIVMLLLDAGANPRVLDSRWHGTPAGWADEGGHAGLAALLRDREKNSR